MSILPDNIEGICREGRTNDTRDLEFFPALPMMVANLLRGLSWIVKVTISKQKMLHTKTVLGAAKCVPQVGYYWQHCRFQMGATEQTVELETV